MNNCLCAALPVAALIFIAPAANAWNLVNSINADARQMPGAPATTVVASGSAGHETTAIPIVTQVSPGATAVPIAGSALKTVVLIQSFM